MRRIPAALFGMSVIWLITTMLAPFTIPPGTVKDLEGGTTANIDHADIWNKMNPFAMAVYYFGDYNCHQLSERSLYLNDNQMPVCARDVGIMFGLTIGTSLLFLTVPCNDPYHTAFTLFPNRYKKQIVRRMSVRAFTITVGILFLIPLAIDGTLQLVTPYESTNPLRLATGLPAGFALGVGFGCAVISMFEMTEGDKMRWVERYHRFLDRQARKAEEAKGTHYVNAKVEKADGKEDGMGTGKRKMKRTGKA